MTDFPDSRTALLTGAASPRGIGRATAHYLAERGWNIGIIDLDASAAVAVAAEISEEHGVKAAGAGANVADESQVRAAIDDLESRLPQVVALINIAGVSSPVPYLEVTADEWNRVIDINLNGVHYATRRAAESMVKNGVGRIVSLSSVSAQRGGGSYSKTPYSAAKAGVIGFTRSVARELGYDGVTVNAISPGPIDTDIMGGTLTDERKAQMSEGIMMGRVGTREEVAALIAFLLGQDSGYITAATYDINGGLQVS